MLLEATFIVTAYGASRTCGGAGTGLTKTQAAPREAFTVAADPAVLPLHSIVYVEGLGLRKVEDIGSRIKGRRLDLYMDDLEAADAETCSAALRFGVQRRRVYLVTSAGRSGALLRDPPGRDTSQGTRVVVSSERPAEVTSLETGGAPDAATSHEVDRPGDAGGGPIPAGAFSSFVRGLVVLWLAWVALVGSLSATLRSKARA